MDTLLLEDRLELMQTTELEWIQNQLRLKDKPLRSNTLLMKV